MTKEEILTAIREVAEKLGHPPTFSQLEDMTPMRRRHIRKHFGNYLWALQECGLTSRFNSRRIPEEMPFPGMGEGGAPVEEDTEHDGI